MRWIFLAAFMATTPAMANQASDALIMAHQACLHHAAELDATQCQGIEAMWAQSDDAKNALRLQSMVSALLSGDVKPWRDKLDLPHSRPGVNMAQPH